MGWTTVENSIRWRREGLPGKARSSPIPHLPSPTCLFRPSPLRPRLFLLPAPALADHGALIDPPARLILHARHPAAIDRTLHIFSILCHFLCPSAQRRCPSGSGAPSGAPARSGRTSGSPEECPSRPGCILTAFLACPSQPLGPRPHEIELPTDLLHRPPWSTSPRPLSMAQVECDIALSTPHSPLATVPTVVLPVTLDRPSEPRVRCPHRRHAVVHRAPTDPRNAQVARCRKISAGWDKPVTTPARSVAPALPLPQSPGLHPVSHSHVDGQRCCAPVT